MGRAKLHLEGASQFWSLRLSLTIRRREPPLFLPNSAVSIGFDGNGCVCGARRMNRLRRQVLRRQQIFPQMSESELRGGESADIGLHPLCFRVAVMSGVRNGAEGETTAPSGEAQSGSRVPVSIPRRRSASFSRLGGKCRSY